MDKFLNSAPVVAINDAVVHFLNTQEDANVRAVIEKVEHTTGLKREKAFYLAILLSISAAVLFSLGQTLHLSFGFAFPALNSLKAVKNLRKSKIIGSTKCTEEACKWLVYWCVFACFATVEANNGMGANPSGVMQFYWLLKTVLCVLLYFPASNGAMVLYEQFIEPTFNRFEAAADAAVGKKTN